MQEKNGVECPIAHASKTLTNSQKTHSQFEKEDGVSKFRQFLFGRKFTLVTDHKPLVAMFSPKKNIPVLTAQRLQRWALLLMAYQYDIRFKPTYQCGNADGLSRLPMGPDERFDAQQATENTEISHSVQEAMDGLPLTSGAIRNKTLQDKILKVVPNCISSGNWCCTSDLTCDVFKSVFASQRFSLDTE